ncbi:unnamed protein product, partial [marine sediment metagenome]
DSTSEQISQDGGIDMFSYINAKVFKIEVILKLYAINQFFSLIDLFLIYELAESIKRQVKSTV